MTHVSGLSLDGNVIEQGPDKKKTIMNKSALVHPSRDIPYPPPFELPSGITVVPTDGPIRKFREWTQQFYSPAGETAMAAAGAG